MVHGNHADIVQSVIEREVIRLDTDFLKRRKLLGSVDISSQPDNQESAQAHDSS